MQTQELMPGPGVFCFPAVLCLPSPCCLFLCYSPAISFLSPPGSPKLSCWSPCFPPSHHLLCISSSLSPSLVCLNLYFPWKQTPSLWDRAPHEECARQEQRSTQGHAEHGRLLSLSTLASSSSSSSSSPTTHRVHCRARAAQPSPNGQWCCPCWQICDHGPLPHPTYPTPRDPMDPDTPGYPRHLC